MYNLEIERKYLIRMPSRDFLDALSFSEIEQIYLLSPEHITERIRSRRSGDRLVCTHTIKERRSELSRIEIENEISEEEFLALRARADHSRRVIEKRRYLYHYDGQCFEIDVFPFWTDRALMELELRSEEQEIRLPPTIEIMREVTADPRYSNSALAREIP